MNSYTNHQQYGSNSSNVNAVIIACKYNMPSIGRRSTIEFQSHLGTITSINLLKMESSTLVGVMMNGLHHGPLARYVKLRVAHEPGMPGKLSLPPQVSDPDMHNGTCVAHMPRCMSGSLTSVFLGSRWRNSQFNVSGKRSMAHSHEKHGAVVI